MSFQGRSKFLRLYGLAKVHKSNTTLRLCYPCQASAKKSFRMVRSNTTNSNHLINNADFGRNPISKSWW